MRHTSLSEDQKLERIFRNAQSDYQLYIRRKDFSTLEELTQLADDRDCIPHVSNQQRGEQHRMATGKLRKVEQPKVCQGKTLPCTPRPMNETRLMWQEDKIKAVIRLEGQLHSAIVDTGATRSFISPKQAGKLKHKFTQVSTNVFLADGTQKHITRAVQVWITFGEITARSEFLVMEGATENFILGLDFLQQFGTTVSCAGLIARSESAGHTQKPEVIKQIRKNKVSNLSKTPRRLLSNDAVTQNQVVATGYLPETNRFLQGLPKVNKVRGPSQISKIVIKDDRPIKLRYAQRNPKRAPTALKGCAEAAVEKITSTASIRSASIYLTTSLPCTPTLSSMSSSTSRSTAASVWARECSLGGQKENATSYTPSVPSSSSCLQYTQVPEELKEVIEKAYKQRGNKQRVRFRYNAYQEEYQVTITRSGKLQIQWRRP